MRSQTATEYLIITAVVIIIAVIVVSSLGGVIGTDRASETIKLRLNSLAPVSVSSWTYNADFTTITIENKGTVPIRFDAIQLDCLIFAPSISLGAAGSKNTIKIPGRFEASSTGLRINYTDQATNAKYTVGTERTPQSCTNIFQNVALFYRFDYDPNGTLVDATTNRNNSLTYAGWTNVRYGDGFAALLNDNTSHAVLPFSPLYRFTTQSITICLWYYPNTSTDQGFLLSKPWNGVGYYNWDMHRDTLGGINVRLMVNTTRSVYTGANASLAGNWTHICGQWGPLLKVYINGALNNTAQHNFTDFDPGLVNGDQNLSVAIGTTYPYGAGITGSTATVGGQIDDLIIWNRSLTDTEILSVYRAGH
jgi:hypothetical protein